ncbi:1-acyl-sn-glycerol-3-phosphate acyltransferase [Corallococcus praedator]|uniref:1-acyl-sn-glycerol-3-phosphate acyltransferase n=2 Tax=Myxococcaceae TaxID=31 RepID=A0ABX9QM43_9BACT|nr:1-acyl-sn-glycerol-3-phosphate acyltransferase [Corallococcus sp. CA047B]RKH32605.1 1-acyl-sn-glycerol-3-phosphate acyltransferase [Corallococcus sp. CA031C]RKI13184.1 1-acyl-sn-glycerol-3-phosphate acyltransferase [Corallococcus praedator]
MMRKLLQTVFAGTAAVGLTGAASATVSVLSGFDPLAADKVLRVWGRSSLAAAGVQHEAYGLEHIPEDGNVVFVCNHQSHFDAMVNFAHIRKHTRYVAKAELFKIPVFGRAMRRAGNIPVQRTGGADDKARLSEAVTAVRERVSVLFFAEGTRSPDGELKPFKRGAATLAIQAQVPVVPMALSGTRLILPKGGRAVRWGQRVALVVGRPVPTQGLTLDDRDTLTRRLEEAVARLYAEARERSGDTP